MNQEFGRRAEQASRDSGTRASHLIRLLDEALLIGFSPLPVTLGIGSDSSNMMLLANDAVNAPCSDDNAMTANDKNEADHNGSAGDKCSFITLL